MAGDQNAFAVASSDATAATHTAGQVVSPGHKKSPKARSVGVMPRPKQPVQLSVSSSLEQFKDILAQRKVGPLFLGDPVPWL